MSHYRAYEAKWLTKWKLNRVTISSMSLVSIYMLGYRALGNIKQTLMLLSVTIKLLFYDMDSELQPQLMNYMFYCNQS